jgi:hypothetical protein
MSVIFKEKQYDRLLILLKEFLIILLLVIISMIILNIFLNKLNSGYQLELKELRQEKEKYFTLIREIEANTNQKEAAVTKYNLMLDLAAYCRELDLNSLQYKNDKITLTAESKSQEKIFDFVESLKADNNFLKVNLVRLKQQSRYFFQLEALIHQ